MIKHFL